MRRSFVFFSLVLALVISLATHWILSNLSAETWHSWRPATCLSTGCFCEGVNESSPIRQRANTYSSLAFVWSGMLIAGLAWGREQPGRFPLHYALALAGIGLVIGLGSAFYHASLTFVGQFLDVLGMDLLVAFMLVYAWERMFLLSPRGVVTSYLLLSGGLAWGQWALPESRRFAFATVLLLALVFEFSFRKSRRPSLSARWWYAGVLSFALAYIIWGLDHQRILCVENSLLQGHAVWHGLGAVALWCLYQYYATEKGNVHDARRSI